MKTTIENNLIVAKKPWVLQFIIPMTIKESKLKGYVYANITGKPSVNLNTICQDDMISIINIDGKYPLVEFLG